MKKSKVLLFQIMVAIILITTSVYAALEVTLELKVSNNNVKQGENVTVTLSLKDVSSKVTSVSGYINYNKDILETLTVDSIVKDLDNTVTIGSEKLNVEDLTNKSISDLPNTSEYVGFNAAPTSGNDTKIVIDFANGVSSNTDLLKINFKVKSDATIGEIKDAIKYQMFVVTAGNEKSSEISQNIDLTVVKAGSSNENIDNNTTENVKNTTVENTQNTSTTNVSNKSTSNVSNTSQRNTSNSGSIKNNTTNNTSKNNVVNNTSRNNTSNNTAKNNTTNRNNTSNKNSNTDNTTASKNLPATGAKMVVIPAIIFIVLAYISYNKYMKYKNY